MSSSIIQTLTHTSSNQRYQILNEYLQEFLRDFLDLDSKELLSNDQSFIELGTDSAQAVEFKLILEKELECSLKTTLLFDYPRLDVLVNFLIDEVLELDQQPKVDRYLDEKNEENKEVEEIAIVGMSCRMPGGVMNPEDFWQLLINNVNAIEEVPNSRWDIDRFYSEKKEPGKVSNRSGGFIKNIKEFDPQFFGISAKEATEMDPQQRILMEVAWEAIENSGQSASNLKGKDIGVFVGIRNTEYYPPEGHRNPEDINFYSAIGTQLSAASGRLSYFLGLTGPSLSIDTACSSSMTAFHYACESIRNNESEGALVGGVNVLMSGEMNVAASQGNMLSSDGFCKTFSSKADGYVRSEGCAVFYLKPLKKAQKDGDPILSIICATGINQDGASGGLTVPYAPAQENLIRKTLKKANLKPEDIDYIEAHGTGTPLGDPIEVQALNNTIGIGHQKVNPLKIGSVKTNIGHTEPVAGLAGLMKTVLSLQHQMIPANLHAYPPNPYINWDVMPIEVVKQNTPWYKNGKTRYAGISSFGFTGTNTHAIIKEPSLIENPEKIGSKDEHSLFVCSAKTEKALKDLVLDYATFFQETEIEDLQDICYTSIVGRSHFQYRFSLISNSKEDVINTLRNSFKNETETYVSKISLQPPKVAFVIQDSLDNAYETSSFLFEKHPIFQKTIEDCDVKTKHKHKFIKFFDKKNDQNDILSEWDSLVVRFTCLYAYAKCWDYWGVTPSFLIGSSTGINRFLVACIAGVFDYVEALQLLELSHTYQNNRIDQKELEKSIEQIKLKDPNIDVVTDTLHRITTKQITSAVYWKNQIMNLNSDIPIDNDTKISFEDCELLLCIGGYQHIGETLEKELKQHKKKMLHDIFNEKDYQRLLLENIQSIYQLGVQFDWTKYTEGHQRKKVILPNYPFQRKHYWVENSKKTIDLHWEQKQFYKDVHPLLGNKIRLALSTDATIRYNSFFNSEYPGFVKDHKIYDDIIVPGAAYIEMALVGGISLKKDKNINNVVLSNIAFREALLLKENNSVIQTSFFPSTTDTSKNYYEFKIHSTIEDTDKENSNGQWKYHVNGILKLENTSDTIEKIEALDSIKSRCPHTKEHQEHYTEVSAAGLHYGSCFQGVRKIWYSQDEALIQVSLPEQLTSEITSYRFHPVLLDSCFQGLSVMLSPDEKEEALMPLTIQELIFFKKPDTELWCYIGTPEKIGNKYYIADFHIVNSEGENIAFIKGLKLIRVKNTKTKVEKGNRETEKDTTIEGINELYSVSWVAQQERKRLLSDKERMIMDPISWLVLSDDKNIGSEFVAQLEKRQERVIELFREDIDYTDIEEWKSFIEDEFDESFPKLKGVVNFWGINQSIEQEGLHGSIKLIQALEEISKENESDANEKPRLWWVTKGGQSVVNDASMLVPEQSTLWGFRTSLASEITKYYSSCIDLDPVEKSTNKEGELLFDEIWNPSSENQIAFRGDNRYVARLSEYDLEKDFKEREGAPLELRIKEYGILENLEWIPQNKKAPKNDEVQIAVAASALNFKDVLHTLGLLKKFSEVQGIYNSKDQPLGFECAGVVTAIGKDVTDIKIGDEVIATSLNGCMKSFITVPSTYVIPKPSTLDMEKASSIPTVFMTAIYGLEELANIKKGDKVLIHACAGGVGQAALQIVQNKGAIVFATASRSKWDFLKSKGVEYIMDSRSLDYADQILEITEGKGVDVVLNSLKGEYISKNLDALGKNGRYIEIGKIDIWNEDKVKEARPDVNYHVFDLSDDVRNDQSLYKKLLTKITERFDRGELVSIPVTIFDITETQEAFAFLSQAKNIGKVVLSMPEIQEKNTQLLSENKNYLITGGLGDLGLKVAQKLGELGVKHIALTSRSTPNALVQEKIEELQDTYSMNIQVIPSDISIKLETQKLFKTLNDSDVPLGGIVHAAGVLDDGVLLQQSWERFQKVMAPKVNGLWNLHECTTEIDLDFFICFSSMSSIMGSSGQTNYAAANAYLDTFAKYRQDMNLPCLTINWGPWQEGGMAASMSKKDQQRIKDLGITSLSDQEALHTFSNIFDNVSIAQLGVWNIDWARYFNNQNTNLREGFLEDFTKYVSEEENSLLNSLIEKPIQERADFFLAYMQREIASLMGLDSPNEIEPKQPLFDLGVDSLVTIDLSNRLQKSIGRELDTSLIFDYPNLEALTNYILNNILELGEKESEDEESSINQVEDITSNLTEEELADELSDLLGE